MACVPYDATIANTNNSSILILEPIAYHYYLDPFHSCLVEIVGWVGTS